MKQNSPFRKPVQAALLAALVTCTTLFFKVPTAVGYISAGDAAVLTAGFLLGAPYGFAAAAVGSALADLLSGFPAFLPGSFVIKGLMAVCAVGVYRLTEKLTPGVRRFAASLAAEALMIGGYFLYESVFLSYGAGAAAELPANVVQALGGAVLATVLMHLLDKRHLI